MTNMQQATDVELLNQQAASTQEGQAANTATINEEDYKSLQSEFTKTRQREIDMAIKLVSKDKKELLAIQDKKLQEKVIKEVYGLANLEEVKLIHGNQFWEDGNNNTNDYDNDDNISQIRKELDLMKYRSEKDTIEKEINSFKKENAILFDTEDAEDRLRDELKYISKELPAEERIKRASKAAFGILKNPNDAAFIKLIQSQGVFVGGDRNDGATKTKTQSDAEAAFKSVF
jgi:pyridoxal biosynthesis lyase PdxS